MDSQSEIPVIPSDWAYPKPIQSTIIFANGALINGVATRTAVPYEILAFPEEQMTIVELVSIFSNPEYTSHIESDLSSAEHVAFDGYTNISSIDQTADGKYIVRLSKPIE